MRDFAQLVSHQSRHSLERMVGVSSRRADVLPLAALVLARLIDTARPRQVMFSAYGLREGLIYDRLSPEEQAADPLLVLAERWAQASGRVNRPDASVLHWAEAGMPTGPAEEGRLRHAACLLSDCAWMHHPEYRAEHAFLMGLRFPAMGLNHIDRSFLAAALHARYAGPGSKLPDVAERLLEPGRQERAQAFGGLLRLAHTVSAGGFDLLRHVPVRLETKRLVLSVARDHADLISEPVERRLNHVASRLAVEAVIESG